VAPTISKPAGSAITTVTYAPANGWAQGSTNTYTIIFADNETPPVLQTNSFIFFVVNEAQAASIINIDFNGIQNNPGPRGPGPTYIGQGPASGGGNTWADITLNTELPDGTDARNLFATGTNLLNSGGGATTVSFTVGPVGADDWFGGSDPNDPNALWGTYLFFMPSVMGVPQADFTISGLGTTPFVNLYFLEQSHGAGAANYVIPGVAQSTFTANGIFSAGNTFCFMSVPVTNGVVVGSTGTQDLTVLDGLTIQQVVMQPGPLIIAHQAGNVILSWSGAGTLQSANEVAGPWTDVTGATNPQTITPSAARKFYRLR
jgi:hypothetical protein